ncbi:MAG: helix-turn-helix transcriptional regulator [Syntrophomonas sp.]
MIRFNLDRLLFEKGKMKVAQLASLTHVNKTGLYAFYNGNLTRIDVSTLDRLCATLNCQPGDLLEFVPDKETDIPKEREAFTHS